MDGIDLIPILPNVLDYKVLSLANMDAVRNSGILQGVLYSAVPNGRSLAARETFMNNVIMRPNTIIYGIRSAVLSEEGSFTFKVRESPGHPIVDSYVFAGFGADTAYRNRSNLIWLPLQEPYCCVSGRITVEISTGTTGGDAVTPLVVLVCAEPKIVFNDAPGSYCA